MARRPKKLTDYAGRELEVIGMCSRCGAQKTRVKEFGNAGAGTIVHNAGCTGSAGLVPFGDHLATRMKIEESKTRDATQIAASEKLRRNPSPFRSDIGK